MDALNVLRVGGKGVWCVVCVVCVGQGLGINVDDNVIG